MVDSMDTALVGESVRKAVRVRPRVFLSYTHSDYEKVESIAEELRRRQVDVWFDEWKVAAGDSLMREIEAGLSLADFVLLFVSAASASSRWMREEYEAARAMEVEGRTGVKLIPVRLDDAPMPIFLGSKVYVDLTRPFAEALPKLLHAIMGEHGILAVDRTVGSIAARISRLSDDWMMCAKDWSLFCDDIGARTKDRARGVYYSAQALVEVLYPDGPGTEPSPDRKLAKWLGCTNRDYLQYRLYRTAEATARCLEQDGQSPSTTWLSVLLDEVFENLNADIAQFGLASHRDADECIAADIVRLFDFAFKRMAGTGAAVVSELAAGDALIPVSPRQTGGASP